MLTLFARPDEQNAVKQTESQNIVPVQPLLAVLTSDVDVVGQDGLVEGADLAGVLPTVHTLRQTDDQLAAVLGLHNLPPEHKISSVWLGGAGPGCGGW